MEDDGELPAPLYDANDTSEEAELSKDDKKEEDEDNQEIRA